jgi:hypothetical protein
MHCQFFEFSTKIYTCPDLTRGTPCALCAKSSKNELAFAHYSLTQGTCARRRYVVPLDILNIAAAITHEMVMPHAFEIESPGTPFDGNFAHQAGFHKVSQIVVRCRPRRTRIHAIYGFENFRGCRMPLVVRQECHYGIALCRAAQPASLQRPFDRRGL